MSVTGIQTSAASHAAYGERETAGRGTPRSADGSPCASCAGEQRPDVSGDMLTLSPEARQEVARLKQRDAEVKAHEQAHMAAGGPYVQGGAQYTYEKGPDGRQYAVGGEVGIDTSPERDPEATIRKMQVVKRAALAPADPSSQDRSVAARADAAAARARVEQARENADSKAEGGAVESAVSPDRAVRAYENPPGEDPQPPVIDLSA